MKKIIPIVAYSLFGLYAVIVLAINFLAYFVTSENAGVMYDGLGRQLIQTPAVLRLIFGQERLYPGFYWFLFDTSLFFGIFGFGALIGKIIEWCEKGIVNKSD